MVGIGNIIPPANEGSPPVNPSAPVRADAHTSGLAASADSGATTAATKVGSLEELKNKAPDLYKAMMQGLATSMIQKWERAEKRRQDIVKQFERR